MQPLTVVNNLQELTNAGLDIREIAVFVPVDFVIFEVLTNDSQAALSYEARPALHVATPFADSEFR